jgi:hypothetical protein
MRSVLRDSDIADWDVSGGWGRAAAIGLGELLGARGFNLRNKNSHLAKLAHQFCYRHSE